MEEERDTQVQNARDRGLRWVSPNYCFEQFYLMDFVAFLLKSFFSIFLGSPVLPPCHPPTLG